MPLLGLPAQRPAMSAAAPPRHRLLHGKRREATARGEDACRRVVAAVAVALALALALAQVPLTPVARAQEANAGSPAASGPSSSTAPAEAPAASKGHSATVEVRTDDQGRKSVTIHATEGTPDEDLAKAKDAASVVLGIGRHGKGVSVRGFGDDADFDSFDEFAKNSPAIAFMVIAIVAVVFLAPVMAIALILWYKMRKARMLNETMLRLAEKGVVPPAEAIGALGAGAPIASSPSVAPLYEQAKQLRRRAAWSDLRKGVILGGIGLGITLWAALDDRSPNPLGLVLLFVGIGYLALWWFEERQIARGNDTSASPAQAAGGGSRPGGSA
jgi:hypothetical protein